MEGLIKLGMYLILAFLFPGLIIFAAAITLFPELAGALSTTTAQTLGTVILIAFVTAHLPFLLERYALNRIWDWMFPELKLYARNKRMYMRSRIIARAQWRKIDHSHYDQTLGEFILFTNTSFWLVILSIMRLITWPGFSITLLIAAVILIGALVTLLYAAPFFKKSYLDILDVLDEAAKEEPHAKTNTVQSGVRD